jgi:hypothetical protein
MEGSEDNFLPGVDPDPDAYYPGEDEEDADIEEVPGLPTDKVDEDAPVEGEELAGDEGEDGERFAHISQMNLVFRHDICAGTRL